MNRLTEIGSDPAASIVRLKSYSGIKSIRALESYLGTSEEEQDAALSWMEKRMKLCKKMTTAINLMKPK